MQLKIYIISDFSLWKRSPWSLKLAYGYLKRCRRGCPFIKAEEARPRCLLRESTSQGYHRFSDSLGPLKPWCHPQSPPLGWPETTLIDLAEEQLLESGKEGETCVRLLGANKLTWLGQKITLKSHRKGGSLGKSSTNLVGKDVWLSSSPPPCSEQGQKLVQAAWGCVSWVWNISRDGDYTISLVHCCTTLSVQNIFHTSSQHFPFRKLYLVPLVLLLCTPEEDVILSSL